MDKSFVRRLKILSFLASSRRPKSRREIADRFNISPKSAGRDADDLAAAGFRVIAERDRSGTTRYRFDAERALPAGFACPACAAKERHR